MIAWTAPGFAQEADVTPRSIEGVVIDETGRPIAGAVVELETISLSDTTDVSGRFMFRSIAPGSHTLTARKEGSPYRPATRKIAILNVSPDPVVILMEQATYAVDEVVVIGSSEAAGEQPESTPSHVEVVTRPEFERTAATVEDVIASTPSAAIRSHGGLGSFSEVSLRGSYSNQVQVYIDGMLLNESAGGSVNLGLIPLNTVERLEIWRSGAPAQFGGDAVGGAINIVTRDFREKKASVSLGYGSFGALKGHGAAGLGPPDSRLVVTLDAARSRNDFEYTSDNGTPNNPGDDYTATRRNNEFRALNGLVKYRRIFGSGVSFELSNHTLFSRKNLPASQHILDSSASLGTTKNLLQSRITWIPASRSWFEAAPTANYIVSREHFEDRDDHVGWGVQDNIYETVVLKGMLPCTAMLGSLGTLSLTPAVSREAYTPDHRLDRTTPLAGDREHAGIVGDIKLETPGRTVTITSNIRRDRYYSTYEGRAGLMNPVTPKPKHHHFTNLQTGVRIEPHPLLSFRWNYGDNWRVPSFYELFGDRGNVVSQPGLRPEHVYRWDAGMRLRAPEWTGLGAGRFEAVYFDTSYRDLIQWYTTNYGFIEPANVAGSRVRGTELIWNMRLFDALSLRGNWTFQESEVTDTKKSYHLGKRLPNRPARYGTSTLEYTHRRATLSWIIDHKESYFLDRSNQPHKKYPGRTLHDVCLSIGFRNNELTWRLMAENITDQKTFDVQGMPKPGRSFSIDLRYAFE